MSQNQITVKQFFAKDAVKSKFEELLGKKANGFVTSVLQVVNNNNLLQKATPESVYNCAAVAATLDLPINNSLGFAWIVPYGGQAQFQIGWKGLVQLANRTGQYKAINVVEVYENQFKSFNRLTEELDADFTQEPSGKIVGYVAYFKLLNGFEKTSYWSVADVEKHAKRFSKTYGGGVWKSDFDAMAKKTVLKNTLSKWGILSIEMQTATIADQAVIKDAETLDVEYIDASEPNAEQLPTITDEQVAALIEQGATLAQIQTTYTVTDEQLIKFG